MFKGSKIIALFVSLLGAFVLWLYVVTTVAPETVGTIANIPVTIEGIGDGIVTSDGTYIMTNQITQTISLELKTSRVNLSKLNPQSIRISAYVSNSVVQNGPGIKNLNYTITFPDTVNINDIDILKQSSSTVQIEVAKMQTKTVPVELKTINKVADEYVFEKTNVSINPKGIEVTGPEDEVASISRALAVVDLSTLDLSDLSVTLHELSVPFVFQDEDGQEVTLSSYSTVADNLQFAVVSIPVQKTKELLLSVALVPGGGITEENTKLTLDTGRIKVKGVPLAIDKLPEELVIGSIDLASALNGAERSGDAYIRKYEIPIDNLSELKNVTNVSGISTVTATLTISGIKQSAPITVTSDQIEFNNLESGLYAHAENREVKIVLQGPVQELDRLIDHDLDLITLQMDLSSIESPGFYLMDGTVNIPGYPNVGIINGTVKLDIVVSSAPSPEQTAD